MPPTTTATSKQTTAHKSNNNSITTIERLKAATATNFAFEQIVAREFQGQLK